jgi:hypothetical protein
MRKPMPLRFAYADPPYVGQAKRRYKDHPDYAGEVDMVELMYAMEEKYDGWALSASSSSLKQILAEAPDDIRVLAWIKPFCAYKRSVRVAFSWEPVFARIPARPPMSVATRDFVVERMTMKKGLTGVKPERVSFWLFNVLGMRPNDYFDDLFPGSGAVTEALKKWRAANGPKQQQHVKVENSLVYGAK